MKTDRAARCARSRTAATTCWSTASRPATWSRPTACTPRCAGCSACDAPVAGRRRYGLRCHVAAGAVDLAGRGALGAGGRGLRDAGGRRPGRRRGAQRRAASARGAARRRSRCWPRGWPGRDARAASAAPARCGSAPGAGWPGGCCSSATPAGYVDALTGEGIALGLAQARAAVAAVAAGRPERYERAWRRLGLAPRPAHPGRCSPRPGTPRCAAGWCRRRPALPRRLRRRGQPAREAGMTGPRGTPGRAGGAARRGRPGRRHHAQGGRAPRRHPAAPGLLLLPLRRPAAGCC